MREPVYPIRTILLTYGVQVMRASVVVAIVASIVAFSASVEGQASIKRPTAIPPQELAPALKTLVEEREFQLIYSSELLADRRTQGASGEFTMDEALDKLLSGTGLTYQYVDEKTVSIVPLGSQPAKQEEKAGAGKRDAVKGTEQKAEGDERKSFWDRFRVAQGDHGQTQSDGAETAGISAQAQPETLDEIVVTAQKRIERLADVPVPVTAVSADELVGSNQTRIQDYYTKVPGLSVEPSYRGTPLIAIRGITTSGGFTNPTVGVVVDDVPYGSSTGLGGGGTVPDIDPGDLLRVEVLRGPQGTLYGASTIGGLLKFVTVDPSMQRANGRIQVGSSVIHHGDQAGYNVRGSVNVPLSDTFAIRASAFTREDPGYIDDPGLGLEGLNRRNVDGGRLVGLWKPSDDFSLKLAALFQDNRIEGTSDVHVLPNLRDLEQNNAMRGVYSRNKSQVYSANILAKLGNFELTTISGYSINRNRSLQDVTWAYGAFTEFVFPQFGPTTSFAEENETEKFSQEVRISSPIGSRVDWLLGAFYTHENSPFVQTASAADPDSAAPLAKAIDFIFPSTFKEYALFTDFTFHLTDRFDLQVGGRGSKNRQTYSETDQGPFVPAFYIGLPSPVVQPKVTTDDNSFTYLLTPRLRISPDLMIYARLASGYRAGGPNQSCIVLNFPCEFDPDTTRNYELGLKSSLLDQRLSIDASIYHIGWKDMQVQLLDPVSFFTYFINAGRAKSRGIELALESKAVSGLTVAAWATWNDAELTEELPSASNVAGDSGDRLPFSSRFSGHFSADREFVIGNSLIGFVGGSVSYVGDRKGRFTDATSPRPSYPSYTQFDLRAGVKRDTWSFNLFANNIADKRGVLTAGAPSPSYFFTYIQPRTVGLSLAKTFDGWR